MSKSGKPILFQYTGRSMVPLNRHWERECEGRFKAGETYRLDEHHERSAKTHRHFFAAVNEAWANLPEYLCHEFPTPDHLRKYALIKSGYCDKSSMVCASKAEALRLRQFIAPMDDYAVITVRGPVLTRHTAKSQDMRSMGKEQFAASKSAVLDVIADMIGTTAEELAKAHAA